MNDPVVGETKDGRSVFLSEMSTDQLRKLVRSLSGEAPTDRRTLERIVLEAIRKGVKAKLRVEAHVWCLGQSHKPRRISLWICRERQEVGRCPCKGTCENSVTKGAGPPRRRRRTMTETAAEAAEPKAPSKSELLRTAFAEKDEWTVEELMERTGYDEKNLKTAIALAQNYERTKADKLIRLVWDREKKTYRKEPMPTEEEWKAAKESRAADRAAKQDQADAKSEEAPAESA